MTKRYFFLLLLPLFLYVSFDFTFKITWITHTSQKQVMTRLFKIFGPSFFLILFIKNYVLSK